MSRILQAARRVFATLVLILLLLFTSDVLPATLTPLAAFLSHRQLVPALLACSAVSVTAILLFTLIFGRWYCSSFCPLGILQDGIHRLPGEKKKGQVERSLIAKARYSILGLCLIIYFLGTSAMLLIVEPWSVFGRLITTFILPVTTFINNTLATALNYWGNYSLVARNYHTAGITVFLFSSVSLLMLLYFSYRIHSRFWCMTLCPVGTCLKFVADKAPVKIRIDEEKCVSCGRCESTCKTGVISIQQRQINSGDCISCFNCLPVCDYDAISYRMGEPRG